MPIELPPGPPKITRRDRATFKVRLQRALAVANLSGRALEKKIGMATGTLSKLYSGRLSLTLRVLREITSAMALGPEVLVEGTGLAFLLAGAPESCESAELLAARAEVDRLRAEAAASETTLKELRHENEALRRELTAARDAEASAKDSAERAQAEVSRMKTGAGAAMTLHSQSERARDDALHEAAGLRIALAAEISKSGEMAHVADGWRKQALERQQRAQYLEMELARARNAAVKASSEEAGKLLLASLASLGIGMAIRDSSRRPRRT